MLQGLTEVSELTETHRASKPASFVNARALVVAAESVLIVLKASGMAEPTSADRREAGADVVIRIMLGRID